MGIYAVLVTIGIIIGFNRISDFCKKLFIVYFCLFLVFHSILPYLTVNRPNNKTEKLTGILMKIIYPITSIIGWAIVAIVLLRIGWK